MLDVRDALLYRASPYQIPGAVRLDPEQIPEGPTSLGLDADQAVVAYCSSAGERVSARVARQLAGRGFRNVRILKGGLGGWAHAGLPLEPKVPGK